MATLPLKDIPKHIHKIIRREQIRIEQEEDKKIKIEHAAYSIIEDWNKQRSDKKLNHS